MRHVGHVLGHMRVSCGLARKILVEIEETSGTAAFNCR